MINPDVSILIGKTLTKVENLDNERVVFTTADGDKYQLTHYQSCCETVRVEDIIGDLDDLTGSPILMAEEATNSEGHPAGHPPDGYEPESFTWTFYKFATVKGYVTIRWYGTSNGYYSEAVDFEKCET